MTEDLAELEQALEASLCRRSLARFFVAAWKVLEPATALAWAKPYEDMCDHVQRLIEDWGARQADPTYVQLFRDLLLTGPPGSLKSRILTVAVPWAWLRWPELRVIAVSINPRVAMRDSMFSRDIIASDWYQRTFKPAWSIRSDSDGKEIYSNTAGGSRAANGLGANIIGSRADWIIVDDLHDPASVESDAQRENVHVAWDSLANRTNDITTSIRAGAAQRTHQDDWSSRRIAENWVHVDLPMLFEADRNASTPLGWRDSRTVEGECLHPERFPPSEIARLRKTYGERKWACLYQGRPSPPGGSLVKTAWLRFWRKAGAPDGSAARPSGCWSGPAVELPRMDAVTIAADLAMGKMTKDGDFNVVLAIGRKGSDFFLLECWRARADFPAVQAVMREMAARHPLSRRVVEQAAAGASLVASLQREAGLSGLIGVPPSGTKEQRLHAVLSFFEAGNVHFPEAWPGLDEAIAELTIFPSAKHDDFVDALSLGLAQTALVGLSPHERFRALGPDGPPPRPPLRPAPPDAWWRPDPTQETP